MKVAIYIRTSTDDQNPENQLKDCLSINTYGEYILIEDKQSAFKDTNREGLESLTKLIKSNKLEHLIVWDFDRLFRNRKKFKEYLLMLKAYNVSLHSYRQVWLEDIYKIPPPWNDIVSDLMINIYGHIAEDESKKKSERVKIAKRIKEGVTYSYKGNKWGRKSLSTQKYNRIIEIRHLPIRKIAQEVNCSVGVVHKILTNFKATEPTNKQDSSISQIMNKEV